MQRRIDKTNPDGPQNSAEYDAQFKTASKIVEKQLEPENLPEEPGDEFHKEVPDEHYQDVAGIGAMPAKDDISETGWERRVTWAFKNLGTMRDLSQLLTGRLEQIDRLPSRLSIVVTRNEKRLYDVKYVELDGSGEID